ncbi:MAG: hypothetical protein ACRDWY_10230 [Actinomycetes bacterium]
MTDPWGNPQQRPDDPTGAEPTGAGPTSGQPASPPQWGQPQQPGQQPQWGQPAPGWGQAGPYPAYGQQPWPGYGAQPPAYGPPTSSKATTVMVLGIVALVTFFALCGLGIIPAIIALVMARGADQEIAASGGALQGAGQVRAGRIMAWVTVGLTVLAVVVVIGLIALGVSSSTSGPSGTVELSSATAGR